MLFQSCLLVRLFLWLPSSRFEQICHNKIKVKICLTNLGIPSMIANAARFYRWCLDTISYMAPYLILLLCEWSTITEKRRQLFLSHFTTVSASPASQVVVIWMIRWRYLTDWVNSYWHTLPLSLFLYSWLFLTGGSVCSHLLTLVHRSRVFLPLRWRRYVPPKRRLTQDLHSATSQKTIFFIVTAVKASNHTQLQG
jgi:hypothetical protein